MAWFHGQAHNRLAIAMGRVLNVDAACQAHDQVNHACDRIDNDAGIELVVYRHDLFDKDRPDSVAQQLAV
jgi:hypothetical protein